MCAAAITGSTSGVSYSQPSIGHRIFGISGPCGGAPYLEGFLFAVVLRFNSPGDRSSVLW